MPSLFPWLRRLSELALVLLLWHHPHSSATLVLAHAMVLSANVRRDQMPEVTGAHLGLGDVQDSMMVAVRNR